MPVDLLNRLSGLSKEEIADLEEALRHLCHARLQLAGHVRIALRPSRKEIAKADAAHARAVALYQRFMNRSPEV